MAIQDIETGDTQLLVSPGRDPEWSPDGRYIAFVKDRWVLPPQRLGHLNCLAWITNGETPKHAEEVWVMDMPRGQMRRIAAGINPHWGGSSHHLYYYAAKDRTLYAISVAEPGSPPTPVLRDTLLVQWSPDSKELSIGSFLGSEMGLWIYDLRTRTASKVLPGPVVTACWSQNRQRLALCLGPPFVEIWLADVTPDRPTVESFDSAQTLQEHSAWLIAKLNREIAADPALIYAYDQRADCALWTDHEKAGAYLQEFNQVLTAYNASACANRAKRILDWPPQQRDRLLPLALMLARKAINKEPENPEYHKVLDKALQSQR